MLIKDPLVFENRIAAGLVLAEDVRAKVTRDNNIVIGLARGGVPVAYAVSEALHAPLDVLVVRKLGVPGHEELAFGAIAPESAAYLNPEVISACRLTRSQILRVENNERLELERRQRAYRQGMGPIDLTGKTAILVDDGLATGATMRAALKWAKIEGAASRIVAVPVGGQDTCQEFLENNECSLCVCHLIPEPMRAVSLWYKDFSQTTDEEVITLLRKRREKYTLEQHIKEKSYNETELDNCRGQSQSKNI